MLPPMPPTAIPDGPIPTDVPLNAYPEGTTFIYMPIKNTRRKVGRNESCPFCASGKKFKHCHGAPVRGETAVECIAAGNASEKPVRFSYTPAGHKGPRPAAREVIPVPPKEKA